MISAAAARMLAATMRNIDASSAASLSSVIGHSSLHTYQKENGHGAGVNVRTGRR